MVRWNCAICIANSRVGAIIIAPVPIDLFQLLRANISIQGITNANVLPDPVFAAAATSFPDCAYWNILC